MSTITMNTEDFSKLLQSMEERIIERLKKQHKAVGQALKGLEEKIDEVETKVETSSEKIAKPKREQSEGQKAWIAFVKEVWEEIKEENPMDDPAGAKKRADAREKRIVAKENKSGSTSKATSKASSDTESEEEKKEKPKKKSSKKEEKKEKPKKKEAVSDSDSD